MGEEAAQLLVAARRPLAALLALALLPALLPGDGLAASPGRVDARDHDAFFLWAGVRSPDVLRQARSIYILAGEVRAHDNRRFVPLRPAAPRVRTSEVWLVLRVERLDWAETVYRQLDRELARWERAGARPTGVQIDFDAATRGLPRYAAFLDDLRRRLPARFRLSVTGLMDWSANGDPAALERLAGVVDEIVIQTYQGRHTIPGYEAYLARLSRLPMPYRIGLAEGGEWVEPARLRHQPRFRGYVVFLANPD